MTATKKTAWQRSAFGKLKLVDLFNALYIAMITVLDDLAVLLFSGVLPTKDDLFASVGVFLAIVIFKFFSNSQGKFAKFDIKEK